MTGCSVAQIIATQMAQDREIAARRVGEAHRFHRGEHDAEERRAQVEAVYRSARRRAVQDKTAGGGLW